MESILDQKKSRFASLMEITKRPELVFVRGEGSWLWDEKGQKYLDFIQGWAVNSLGHCPEEIVSAIKWQAGQLIHCSPAFYNAPMIKLADLLVEHSGLDRVFFANSGAEANEGAIKLARKWGQIHKNGAYEIITFHQGFHGRTLATMSASGKPQWEKLYEPKVPGFKKVPFNDLEAVENAITEKTVAILIEPIQGEAGVFPAKPDFLKALRSWTREKEILLILDEIQTGMGRTGKLFAYQWLDILPDILTLGKGIGGGVPLAALLARESVCCFEHGDQGGTFNGSALIAAVGEAVLHKIVSPGFLTTVCETGAYLKEKLKMLSEKRRLGPVRGQGLLLALEIGEKNGTTIVEAAMQNGLLINSPRPSILRFMPSLTVSFEEIDQMIEILDRILGAS